MVLQYMLGAGAGWESSLCIMGGVDASWKKIGGILCGWGALSQRERLVKTDRKNVLMLVDGKERSDFSCT